MLQKLLTAVLLCASMAAFISCGKNASHYVYAAIPAASQLAVFREDPYSGVLTQLSQSPYTVGNGAESVVIHPSKKFLYVANAGQGENDVSLFDINSDGTVTEVTPRMPVGTLPILLAVDAAGNYLYVANALSNNISVFSIASGTGALTAVAGSPFQINLPPKTLVLSPTGNYLYVSAPGNIAAFSVTSGVPTLIGLTATRDNDPSALVIDPAEKFLYCANTTDSSISVFTIGAPFPPGTLSEIPQSPLADSYSNPVALALDPTGSYLYVANQGSNNIATYSIPSGGFPVVVTDSPFASQGQPSFIAADPNGKYIYVGNQGTSAGIQAFGASSGSLNSISTYSVGNTPKSIAVLE